MDILWVSNIYQRVYYIIVQGYLNLLQRKNIAIHFRSLISSPIYTLFVSLIDWNRNTKATQ